MKIGVFICECGTNIAATVDVKRVVEYAKSLPNVVISRFYKYMCSDVGGTLIKDSIKKHNLDGVVIGSCSPRMHEHFFRTVVSDGGVNPYCLEIANIREQCSWVHSNCEKATEKAEFLIQSAVAKTQLSESLETSTIPVIPEALVIGGGIAGMQASLDLANTGFKVYLVERTPSLGGRMAQLYKTFPALNSSTSLLTPKMAEIADHPNIELFTYSEIISFDGNIGNYTAKIRKKPRYIDMEKCTGCGDCIAVCKMKEKVPCEFDMNMGKRSAPYIPFPQATPLKYTIDPEYCLFLSHGKCEDNPACITACVQKAIDFNQKEEIIEIKVGAIIVTTGYDLLDSKKIFEYGYSVSPNVITTLELERLMSPSGPTKGDILCTCDSNKPKSITFILCIGSRDETQCPWCCRIGCMTALKQSNLLRKKFGDDIEINICYTDIRTFGKGYEEFYRETRGMNTNFFLGRPSEVRPMKDYLKIDIFDEMTHKLFEIKTDIIVLVPALVPRSDAADLARLLHLSLSSDGFFLEAHPKLRPMDTFVNGIFIAGCCQGPKDIQDTIAQACGAAARVEGILSKKELEVEPLIAAVDKEICTGCGICVEVCSYEARLLNERTKIAEVKEALCTGCGACIVACPSNASIHKNLTRKQILRMIEEII